MLVERIHWFAGESESSSPAEEVGCFALEPGQGDDNYYVKNPYYNVGGKTYVAQVENVSVKDGIVALNIDLSSTFPSASIMIFSTVSSMQNAQKAHGIYILPLYKFTDGAVECDFRVGAPAVAWEFPS